MKKTQVEQESRIIVGAHGVAAEEDHLILGKVISVGVISLVIFIVGGIWAWRIQVATEKEQLPDGPAPRPPAMGQYEVGIVNQRLFEQDFHAAQKISTQQQALRNGWGDQPGVAAHPNLEQAMERVITDARRAPPPPPAPETVPSPESPSPTSPPR
ncbi:hypothetical protein POL68_16690 [Stigmatella sp. ncwal1]|uniref:Uncharacterized protein n=1 Tax=Stigmatella ashevillensis TaxID=2995309 RepID=A0ABT5DCP6_9BACT|nr:hypothetical protein [Stigmatella ashevillena]MDC0710116.1 hypothetical protein [Stigmatella ashevillena]